MNTYDMDAEGLLKAFKRAQSIRQPREARMDQAFKYAMPGRGSFFGNTVDDQIDDVFDETAIVAVQEFASRLQAGLTPNFSRWSNLTAGSEIGEDEKDAADTALDQITSYVFEVIGNSNFSQEVYEGYLDLAVTLGCLEIEEGTALQPCLFNAVPVTHLWVDNGPFDRIDKFFRMREYTPEKFTVKYPDHTMPSDDLKKWMEDSSKPKKFLECTIKDWSKPNEEQSYRSVLELQDKKVVVRRDYKGIGSCPMIAFRWSKAAGEVWGSGPLLNALPAIKTCNMVVQMILENAQMSIAGMYNLDDDGSINVDTIQLLPGTIIPRIPGTQGLTPIQPGGDFRVSDLVLNDMRQNIKRALYNDMLGNPEKTPMSATEVAERMADLSRQIGAAFGRLQAELVIPVIQRVVYILKKKGLIDLPAVNGKTVKVVPASPLAQAQNQIDIQAVDRLVEFVGARFGPQLANIFIKGEDVSKYVGDKLQVPGNLVRNKQEMAEAMQQMMQLANAAGGLGAPVEGGAQGGEQEVGP